MIQSCERCGQLKGMEAFRTRRRGEPVVCDACLVEPVGIFKDEMTMARERRDHDEKSDHFKAESDARALRCPRCDRFGCDWASDCLRYCTDWRGTIRELQECIGELAEESAERLTRISVLEHSLADAHAKREQMRVGVRTLYFDLLKIIAEDGAPVNHPFRAVVERIAAVVDATAPETT